MTTLKRETENWNLSDQAIHDFAWCEAMIQHHSSSFYRAFKHLADDKAKAVFAIYAFCRTADDLVDEEQDAAGLADLRARLAAFAAGDNFAEPMWRALRLTFDRFLLDASPYFELLDGMAMDLNPTVPENMAGLERYCYLAAGTVGLMLCPLLARDPKDDHVQAVSIKLGIAMQLTNILRDVGTDRRIGRVYLPQDMMQAYGVELADLDEPIMSAALIRLWENLATRAENYYSDVEQDLSHFEPAARLSLLLSLNYYRAILRVCRRSGYALLRQRIYVSSAGKLMLFWKTRLQIMMKRMIK